jgi:hypothetical protein
MFTDAQGMPQGILVDITNAVASKEGWTVRYIRATMSESLKNLENGSIDLLPDVLFSEERSKRFYLNRIPVLSDWLDVYKRTSDPFDRFDQLDRKKIAVVDKSAEQEMLYIRILQLGIKPDVKTAPDYAGCLKLVQNGQADAALASRFFQHSGDCPGNVAQAGIIFYPASVFFAASSYQNKKLLDAIDNRMRIIKNDFGSTYYKSLGRWLGGNEFVASPVPAVFVENIEAAGLIIAAVVIILLARQVSKYRAELRHKVFLLQQAQMLARTPVKKPSNVL